MLEDLGLHSQLRGADEEVRVFEHQVAGHQAERLRRYGERWVLKPLVKRELFVREAKFYEEMRFHTSPLRDFLPDYRGAVVVDDCLPCLVLEDLTAGLLRPCLADIKMGRQTFEPSASVDKKERESLKYPHQEEVGFRVTGFKAWDVDLQQYLTVGKKFGRSLCPEEVPLGLGVFFFDGRAVQMEALRACVNLLERLLDTLGSHRAHTFYCSSLLLCYDAETYGACRVKMIDFAHVNHCSEPCSDEGYLHGLQVLLRTMKSILLQGQSDLETLINGIQQMRTRATDS